MDNLKRYLNELSQMDDGLALICHVIQWLRPDDPTQTRAIEAKILDLVQAMDANPEEATLIRERVHTFVVNLCFLPLYSKTGILPRRSFVSELRRRVYDQLMPKPPVIFGARNLIDQMFDKRSDPLWVEAVPDEMWMQLYRVFILEAPDNKVEH